MKVLFVADIKGWAWWWKSQSLAKYLSPIFDKVRVIDGAKFSQDCEGIIRSFNSIHLFGWRGALRFSDRVHTTIASFDHERKKTEDAEKNLKKFRAVACASRELFRIVRNFTPHAYCVPNGVDHTVFVPKKREYGKNIIVGWVGKPMWRLDPKKYPYLHFMGEGAMWPKIRTEIEKIPGIETREIALMPANAIGRPEMVEFYQGIDVFICPHYKCGTPNPAFEAASCGVPVITTPCGAFQDFAVHGKNAIVVSGYDDKKGVERTIKEFVSAVKYLNDNRSEIRMIGDAARHSIEAAWTWEKRALDWIPMIEKAAYR